MNRQETLLRGLSKDQSVVVEIGPSFSPLAAKRDGWNAFTIDHASRDGLVAKYAASPEVDTSLIEEVDFVWSGGSIADAVPQERHGTFDAFIASHVIEHTTDVVRFLLAAQTLVKPDGLVVLAVPDKRKCFDFFRAHSTTAQAVAAFEGHHSRHTAATHYEHFMNAVLKETSSGWSIDDARPFHFAHRGSDGRHYQSFADEARYIDAHAWVWVPASFKLMMLELAQLGLLNIRVEIAEEAHYTEFYVWLRRGYTQMPELEFQDARLRLHQRIIVELAEQSRQIPGSPLYEVSHSFSKSLQERLQQ